MSVLTNVRLMLHMHDTHFHNLSTTVCRVSRKVIMWDDDEGHNFD